MDNEQRELYKMVTKDDGKTLIPFGSPMTKTGRCFCEENGK